MKRPILTLIVISFGFLFQSSAQVNVDHSIVLTGAGSNARLQGVGRVQSYSDAASVDYIQKDSLTFGPDGGSANAYSVTLSPAPSYTSYPTGMVVSFKAANSNTGASTLAVNGHGTANILKNYNLPLVANDILAGQIVTVMFDGTNFQMLSQLGNAPASYWTLSGNNIYNNNNSGSGLVGVGTNGTPNTSLDVNGGLATRYSTAASFLSGGTITVGNSSHIIINSGSATNAAYTFSLSNGQTGQYLTLEMASAKYAQLLTTGSNVQLSANADFTPYSTLTLKWDGTYWAEIARSASTLSYIPVTLTPPTTTYTGSSYNGKVAFSNPGPSYFIVPPGITQLYVKLWGAAGGGPGGFYGGTGAYVAGYLTVTPGQSVFVITGQQGSATTGTSGGLGGYGGGGNGGASPNDNGEGGGGGGGRSAIQLVAGTDVATAGGGGGGGQASKIGSYNSWGGTAGESTAANGAGVDDVNGQNGAAAGKGGITTGTNTGTGGAAGAGCSTSGNAGTQYTGGAGGSGSGTYPGTGGGGGGGYFGGGGGGGCNNSSSSTTTLCGGGGGGSSYTGGLLSSPAPTNLASTAATGTGCPAVPNNTDVDYMNANFYAFYPGYDCNGYTGNGLVVIYW